MASAPTRALDANGLGCDVGDALPTGDVGEECRCNWHEAWNLLPWRPVDDADATERCCPAAKSYEEGARAQSRGDYGSAAIAFARADSVSPSEEAFSAAVGAALLADDVVIGTSLVERATGTGRPLSTREAALVERARERFAHRAARIRLRCLECSSVASATGAAVVAQERGLLPTSITSNTPQASARCAGALSVDRS
ncbi:MAG: hypothetical protein JST00_13635 [Deltaproteobacteria bacterium]|nr:hypothetical protein [Deltaproteobacteria bacterium]